MAYETGKNMPVLPKNEATVNDPPKNEATVNDPPKNEATVNDPPKNEETADASSSDLKVEKERKMMEAKIGVKHCEAMLTTADKDALNKMTETEATKAFNDINHQCHILLSKMWFIQQKFPNIKAKIETQKTKDGEFIVKIEYNGTTKDLTLKTSWSVSDFQMYSCHLFSIFKTQDIKKHHLFKVASDDKKLKKENQITTAHGTNNIITGKSIKYAPKEGDFFIMKMI